jgi:hypothetical protein
MGIEGNSHVNLPIDDDMYIVIIRVHRLSARNRQVPDRQPVPAQTNNTASS